MIYQYNKFIFFFLFLITISASASTIKGKLTDKKSGEPLAGGVITLIDGQTKQSVVANLDGSYTLNHVVAGTYEVVPRFVGYAPGKTSSIIVTDNKITVVINLEMTETALQLDEVTVANSSTQSDKAARNLEKNADIVQNILSAKTIQLLPDITVANALQRVSGVAIQRSASGEGRYAIIRGMDQRYNNILVNGIKIPSPDAKYRYVPMDLFPSEMLERLEVIKSLTPSMEADAVGGTMNLVMKNAPQQFLLSANVGSGISGLFGKSRPFTSFDHKAVNSKSPAEIHDNNYQATPADFSRGNLNYSSKNHPLNATAGLTIGGRLLHRRLGAILSASYQDINRGSNSTFLVPNSQPTSDNKYLITTLRLRKYSVQTRRLGLHNKIDFSIKPGHTLSLYNMYVQMNEYETRKSDNQSVFVNLTDYLLRSREQKQSVYSSSLRGDHIITQAFKLNWTGTYAVAKSKVPDMAEYDYQSTEIAGENIVQKSSRIWQRNTDKDVAGYLNLIYSPVVKNIDPEISVGGLYRHKTRDNYYNSYLLKPVYANSQRQLWSNYNNALYEFNPATDGIGSISTANPNTYSSSENVSTGYGQVRFMATKKLQVLGGARIEHTEQNYATIMPKSFEGRAGTISYTDVLPSVNFKYGLNGKQNVRASYFRSITRPDYYQIIPTIEVGEVFDIKGNYNLKHSVADNFDLRYELFPGGANQVLVGGFLKRIKNPIEYAISPNAGGTQYLMPLNFGTANNFGIEAVATKFVGMFGVSANYTYTRSRITTKKQLFYIDNVTSATSSKEVDQTRSLQGQADHIGNVSLLYKNPKIGLDLQVAFVYTGKQLSLVSPYYNLDYYKLAQGILDFSIDKKIGNHFAFYVKVNNLTNTPSKTVILQAPEIGNKFPDQQYENKTVVGKDIYQINILSGFRYKF